MESMNIALPANLKEYVRHRTEQGGYSTASEYIRELIRADQRNSAQARLETELLQGLASGPAEEMTSEHWAEIRTAVRDRIKSRKKN